MPRVALARSTSALAAVVLSVGATLLLTAPFAAHAVDTDRYTVSELGLNFDVPESPAFTVLDLNPQTVTRPATPRDFATALINGLDKNGNFQSGLAIEFNVWGLANRNDLNDPNDLKEFRGTGYWNGQGSLINDGNDENGGLNLYRTLLYRTALSFATTKGSDDEDEALRIAAGVRMTPWDPGNARLLMGNCLVGKMRNLRNATGSHSAHSPLRDKLAEVHGSMATELPQTAAQVQTMIAQIDKRCPTTNGTPCPELAGLKADLPMIWDHIGIAIDDKPSDAYAALDALAEAEPTTDVHELLLTAQAGTNDLTKALEARKKATDEVTKRAQPVEPPAGMLHDPSVGVPKDDTAARIAKATADRIVGDCREEEKGRWNGSSWDVAFAPSWISEDGSAGEAKWNGGAVWTSLAIGSDIIDLRPNDTAIGTRRNYSVNNRYSQVILHGRYRFKERATEEEPSAADAEDDGSDTNFAKQNTWLVGARYRFLAATESMPILGSRLGGLDQRFGVSFEAALTSNDVTDDARKLKDDTYVRWAVIPTFRITENMWIDVAFGTETGRKGEDDTFVLSSIKYGYGEGPWPSHSEHSSEATPNK